MNYRNLRSEEENMKKAVSIKDIADALGLSRNTVSKALNGQHVPLKTKELIFKKARELNYKSFNDVATNKNYRLLLLSGKPFHNINFFIPLVKSIEENCYKNNYDFFEYTCKSNLTSFSKIADYIKNTEVDGIIVIESFETSFVENLLSLDIPICFIDFPGRFFKTDKTYDLIVSSDQKSVCNYVKSLIKDKGFHNFSFVGDIRHCLSFHERYMGMLRALERSNISHSKLEDILDDDDTFKYGDISALKNKIREFKKIPDCFVCCNDFVARKITIALKQLGYLVPEDTTVIGYDGAEESRSESPTITTFLNDKEFLGIEAVAMLVSRIENRNITNRTLFIESGLILGESTEK